VKLLRTEALVLRCLDYSDSSRVVDFLTPEHGRVSALAKGGRNYRNKPRSLLDLLARGRAILLRKEGRALDLLSDFETIDSFPGLRRRLERTWNAFALLEVLRAVSWPEAACPEVFALALACAGELERSAPGEAGAPLFVLVARLVALLGHAPVLDRCALCGAPARGRGLLSARDGGFVCARCGARRPGLPSFPEAARGALASLLQAPSGAPFPRVPPALRAALGPPLVTFLSAVLERELPVLQSRAKS